MKKTLFLLFIVVAMGINAQAQRFFNLTADEVKIDTALPRFTHTIELTGNYNDSIYEVSIVYPEFIDMPSADIARYNAISGSILPTMPAVHQQLTFNQKKPSLQIWFMPIVMQQNKPKFLVSFMLSIKAKPLKRSARLAATRATIANDQRYAPNSVLAQGRWAKIRVNDTGVFELTNDVIRRAGFNDLSKVKIYGYGGWLQNEKLEPSYLQQTDDLKEIASCMVNGKRLFFAHGTVSWNNQRTLTRTRNPYSDYGYYFITQTNEQPLFVDSVEFKNNFDNLNNRYHSLYEVDNFAWFEGGRNLFDATPISANQQRTYNLKAPQNATTANLYVNLTCNNAFNATILLNGQEVGQVRMTWDQSTNGADFYNRGKAAAFSIYDTQNVKENNEITIRVDNGTNVRLDYISMSFNQPFDNPQLATTNFPQAQFVYNITNQNLHADPFYDMVIIIPASQKLRQQAERLKAFHEQHDSMRVRIVPADELYNEFSSGTPDANAYRRYMKMLYDKAGNNQNDMPKYLVLFGDGAFDNRMNTPVWQTQNPDDYLLCYESENSFHKIYCYVDDGFYCLLDDGEGDNLLSTDKPDIAVGRFPVTTNSEAQIMVDKIVNYYNNHNAGNWQNTICFMGDDGNNNLHMQDAEDAANKVIEINPAYRINKIMWDAYKYNAGTQGSQYPDVTKAIKQQQANGALIMDYIGHGIEYQISHENVLRLSDFENFSNSNLPLWITASCDIMPFDGTVPNIGEAALLNPRGGAVAFFGTTRTVYANYNKQINMAFIEYALTNDKNGKPISIGEAQRLAKNKMIDRSLDLTANKLQYSLLGDPALVLRRPTIDVEIDSINNQKCDNNNTITLKANQIVNIKGSIPNNPNFKGRVFVLVRDAEENVVCRLNKAVDADEPFVYKDRTKVLFNGVDSVRNAKFSVSFAMPKDISYSKQKGLINVYVVNDDRTMAGNGYFNNFTLEASQTSSKDSVGPSIYAYLNYPSFVNGAKVNSTPMLVVQLADDNGINVSGNGIGHDLQIAIDGDANKTYSLNEYFNFDFGSYTRGTAIFSIPELAEGPHTLKIRAWDVLNNSSTSTLRFNVSNNFAPSIVDISATNNPAKSNTTFIVNHNYSGNNMNVRVEVFDSNGQIVWRENQTNISSNGNVNIPWDLSNNSGIALKTGVYLYRVTVWTPNSEATSQTKKLIISK